MYKLPVLPHPISIENFLMGLISRWDVALVEFKNVVNPSMISLSKFKDGENTIHAVALISFNSHAERTVRKNVNYELKNKIYKNKYHEVLPAVSPPKIFGCSSWGNFLFSEELTVDKVLITVVSIVFEKHSLLKLEMAETVKIITFKWLLLKLLII